MAPRRLVLGLAAAATATLAAVSVSARGSEPGPVRSPAPLNLGDGELASMVLPKTALGRLAKGLELDSQASGSRDALDASDASLDPNDTAETLAAAGYVRGYALAYRPRDSSRLRAGGLVSIASRADLFRDDDAAAEYLAGRVVEQRLYVGKRLDAATTLEQARTLPVRGLARAFGSVVLRRVGTASRWTTAIAVQEGRVVATVSETRADAHDSWRTVRELASALRRRILGVLIGRIPASPALSPSDATTLIERPKRSPDLAPLALSADDVGGAARVGRQGYLAGYPGLAAFSRDFRVGTARVGGSELIGLRSQVWLMANPVDASAFLKTLTSGPADREPATRLTESLGLGEDFQLERLTVRKLPPLGLGYGAAVLQIQADTPAGKLSGAVALFRVGAAVGGVTAVGPPGRVRYEDVLVLANAAAARLANAHQRPG